MGSFHPQRRVFRRGDNVLTYWVDHAEGFEIRSGRGFRARVEAVVVDPHRGSAKALIVRRAPLHRRRLIPVEAVVAVDPFRRRLEIERARPHPAARASRSLVQLVAAVVVAVVTGTARVFAWTAPRLRQLTVLAYRGARGIASVAATAWVWLIPRVKSGGAAALAVGFGLALRFGGVLAARAKSTAAWSAPRLSAAAGSARTHTETAVAQLGPRVSRLARTAAMQAVAVGCLCVLAVVAAASWIAPRLRATAEAVALATLTLGVAAAGAVHLLGTRLSHHVRYVSALRRD